MALTPEQRAEISRKNGAKSHGPVTPEGKEKSARNSITHGRRAEKLAHFAPPHFAALCNEQRADFNRMLDEQRDFFQPKSLEAARIVRDITVARWTIRRLEVAITNHWNLALIEHAKTPITVIDELGELQIMDRATTANYSKSGLLPSLHREIEKQQRAIERLERYLRTIHAHYPQKVYEQTQHQSAQPVENKSNTPQPIDPGPPGEPAGPAAAPPVYITENTEAVINFYKTLFPGRDIIALPPDQVAKDEDIDDDIPPLPRKAV